MAHQGKEARNGKCLVTVAENLEIGVVMVVVDRKHGNGGINGYHEENSNDSAGQKLAPGLGGARMVRQFAVCQVLARP